MSRVKYRKTTRAFDEVEDELDRATDKFGAMASAHEGYAILLEELDELWKVVQGSQKEHVKQEMRDEATQVAAMAIRFVIDCT